MQLREHIENFPLNQISLIFYLQIIPAPLQLLSKVKKKKS